MTLDEAVEQIIDAATIDIIYKASLRAISVAISSNIGNMTYNIIYEAIDEPIFQTTYYATFETVYLGINCAGL